MKHKGLLAAAAAVAAAAALVLTGCSSGGGPSTATVAPDEQLTLGFQVNGGQLPQYVAGAEGFFEQNGLNVKSVQFNDSTSLISALERGDVDVISTIPGGPLAARAAGFDLQTFIQNEAAKYEAPDSGTLIVAADSPIASYQDLIGKKVAENGGTKGQQVADFIYALKQQGIDPNQITFVDAPFATHLDMLKSAQVDAVLTIDPFTTSIVSSGVGKVIGYPYLDSNPGQPLSAWWATSDFIKNNPSIIEKFQKSLEGAIDWLYADEDRARTEMATFTGLDPALVAQMPLNNWSYHVDKAAWDKNIEILLAQGGLPATVSTDEYWAPTMNDFVATGDTPALGKQ